jgi:hypothetical protein
MFALSSGFIWDFKTGDNISFNLKIVEMLYAHYAAADDGEKQLLRKLIIVELVSITEAMLYDFHERVQGSIREGVDGLATSVIDYIRRKTLEEFEKCIVSARKHNLLGTRSQAIYNRLDELRRLRNRVHIQNSKGDFERDDSAAFSESRKELAERVLEKVVRALSEKYPRPEHAVGHVADFSFPWAPYYV